MGLISSQCCGLVFRFFFCQFYSLLCFSGSFNAIKTDNSNFWLLPWYCQYIKGQFLALSKDSTKLFPQLTPIPQISKMAIAQKKIVKNAQLLWKCFFLQELHIYLTNRFTWEIYYMYANVAKQNSSMLFEKLHRPFFPHFLHYGVFCTSISTRKKIQRKNYSRYSFLNFHWAILSGTLCNKVLFTDDITLLTFLCPDKFHKVHEKWWKTMFDHLWGHGRVLKSRSNISILPLHNNKSIYLVK